MSILTIIIGYTNYEEKTLMLKTRILSQMHICSLELTCKEFNIDFIPKEQKKTYTLYESSTQGLMAFFPILNSEKNFLRLSLSPKQYQQKITKVKTEMLKTVIPIIIGIIILSILFSLYSLYPLRNALKLTEEFIKDILHDFNTPLSSLRLNSSMLTREIGENNKVKRIESSVNSILELQNNLSFYLHNHEMQQEEFFIKSAIDSSIHTIEKNYLDITFSTDIPNKLKFLTNEKAFMRIVDNLLTNAAKYNKKEGLVEVKYNQEKRLLQIIDTGVGIENPNKIFTRFYTEHKKIEQERGLGIGLHIVQKLCDELKIKIKVDSVVDEGTTFSLDVRALLKI